VIGLIQHITFDDWLPNMFGMNIFNKFIGPYKFDPEANPAILSEFQVGALRVFDTFIAPTVPRMNPDTTAQIALVPYKDLIQNPEFVNTTSVREYINGATRSMAKVKNIQLIDALR